MIAALYVETGGCYFDRPDVDPWDVIRDARSYAGPHPVVAHPPCQRWGRFWHVSRKPTWLYAAHVDLPELNWSRGDQRLHPVALERYGYEKARRIGITAMIGGKDKTKIRNATPERFRDVLISMATTAYLLRAA